MENRNENGRGIFYGVIGVATLVVAMIGATFAYFSAETGTGNNAITATAANITLEMGQPVTTGLKQNIIPVDETQDGFATGGYVGVGVSDAQKESPEGTAGKGINDPRNKNCVDDDGNEFCSVYTFTVKNPSTTTAQKVYAQMDVITNTFQANTKDNAPLECPANTENNTIYCGNSNFAFAIFKGTAADVDNTVTKVGNEYTGGWNVDGTATATYYGPTAVPTSGSGESMTGGVMMHNPLLLGKTGDAFDATPQRIAVEEAPDGDPILTNNIAGTAVLGKAGDMVVKRTPVPALSGTSTHTFRLAALDQTLKPGGQATYTVVMWLHENKANQQDDETKTFAGGITFSTSLGGSGVTAVLAATGIPNAGQ